MLSQFLCSYGSYADGLARTSLCEHLEAPARQAVAKVRVCDEDLSRNVTADTYKSLLGS